MQEDIIQQLHTIFNEGYQFVVWHDENGDFVDSIKDLSLDGVTVVWEEENRRFDLKYRINTELTDQKVLFYRREILPPEKDWFADVEQYAYKFRADALSLLLRDLGIKSGCGLEGAIRKHQKFLSKKTNIRKFKEYSANIKNDNQVELVCMALALGIDNYPTLEHILIAAIRMIYEDNLEQLFKKLDESETTETFLSIVEKMMGFPEAKQDLKKLPLHVILTAASYLNLPEGIFDVFIARSYNEQKERCYSLVREWCLTDLDLYKEVLDEIEENYAIADCLNKLDIKELKDCDILRTADAILLKKLINLSCESGVSSEVLDIIALRKSMIFYQDFADYYLALWYFKELQQHVQKAEEFKDAPDAVNLWNLYISKLYQVDADYRHCLYSAQNAAYNSHISDSLVELKSCAGRLYKNAYLEPLNKTWSLLVQEDLHSSGYIKPSMGIPPIVRQQHFYMEHVEGLLKESARIFVIISDAFRYEIAFDLKEALEQQTRGQVEIDSMQSTFPSKTSTGMAALLPYTKYEIQEDASVLLDDVSSEGILNRGKILAAKEPSAIAYQYTDFTEKSSKERKSLVEDSKLVYIYHNTIDAIGDDSKKESKVFSACADAINELASLVQMIVKELRGSRILITSDHGFLYADEDLSELDKMSVKEIDGSIYFQNRRVVLADKNASCESMLKVSMNAYGAPDMVGFTPRSTYLIKKAGGGQKYVHGGISLQEMCVPVLKFRNYRSGQNGYKETSKAEINLVDSNRVITSSHFLLRFFQTEPVQGKVLPCDYDLVFENSYGKAITNVETALADLKEQDSAARQIEVNFSLKPGEDVSSEEAYYLVVRDRETQKVVFKEPFKMKISFMPAFDWDL